jgi:hypothetical protein
MQAVGELQGSVDQVSHSIDAPPPYPLCPDEFMPVPYCRLAGTRLLCRFQFVDCAQRKVSVIPAP